VEFYIKKFDRNCSRTVDLVKLWWKEKTGDNLGSMGLTDYGFMCFNSDHRPICAIFLYPVMGSAVAFMNFPIANPNVFRHERRDALKYLATMVEKEASKLNYSYVVSYAGSKGAKEFFTRENFKVAERDAFLCIKDLRSS
jgi:hypothetical protein